MLPLFEERVILGNANDACVPFLTILRPINLIAFAFKNNCFFYKIIPRRGNETAVQKLTTLKLQKHQSISSAFCFNPQQNQILAILNSSEIVSLKIDDENVPVNDSISGVFKCGSEKILSIFSINDEVLVVAKNGTCFVLSNPDVKFSTTNGIKAELSSAAICQCYKGDQFICAYLVVSSNKATEANFSIVKITSSSKIDKSQVVVSNILKNEHIIDLCMPEFFDENESQAHLRLVIGLKSGQSKMFDVMTGLEDAELCFPFNVKGVLSKDKFIGYQSSDGGQLFVWCEPINHVMCTIDCKDLKCMSCSDCVIVSVQKEDKIKIYSTSQFAPAASTTIFDIIPSTLQRTSNSPTDETIDKNEDHRYFSDLCEILQGAKKYEESVWNTYEQKILIVILRSFDVDQVRLVFRLCVAGYYSENNQLRAFVLSVCDMLLVAQRDVIIELLALPNESQFRQDFGLICRQVTDDLNKYEAISECCNTYETLSAIQKMKEKNQKRDGSGFYITYISI